MFIKLFFYMIVTVVSVLMWTIQFKVISYR
nr:MAG TPA: hypothetical protein [Caudoviricetes sp.]